MFPDFRERERDWGGVGSKREAHQLKRETSVASRTCPDQGPNLNLGMCPDQNCIPNLLVYGAML